MEPIRTDADIAIPLELTIISEVLKDGDPTVEVYLVGGAVRDYLYHKFHTDQSKPFKAKDYDLATNLSEEDILHRLSTESAVRFFNIRVKEKESVDTFGVVFCSVAGKGPFEVAPFRKDIGGSDGRHPDRVERGTIYEDAMRRDFTVNNLYYDFINKVILDFNEGGAGIGDVKARSIRCVGDPFDRFEEDKLRILRMIRFFSRYNKHGLMKEWLDQRTRDAIFHYEDLRSYKGMSGERIMTEFLLGLKQSLNTSTYLKNYRDLRLFPAVFPNSMYSLPLVEKIGNIKSPRVVLATLLLVKDIGEYLNGLNYPNNIAEPVDFLHKAMVFDPNDAVDVIKARDRRIIKTGKKKTELTEEEQAHNAAIKEETTLDLMHMMDLAEDPHRKAILEHLASFACVVPDGEHFMTRGYQGAQIGEQQRKYLQGHWSSSLRWHLTARKLDPSVVK
jgi:tRNA nucleotidyltransferase/poly(A) polymerase